MPAALRFTPWFCGLPCDPMKLEVRADSLAAAEGGCPTCREEVSLYREAEGPPRAAGKEVSTDEAVEAAARLLEEARSPFIFGMSRSSSSTALRAAALAAAIGGTIDVEDSERVQADLVALSTFGLPSATFGEIRERADLLLLWRCDPRVSHAGMFASRGRSGGSTARRVILVAPMAGSGAPADLDIRLGAAADLDAALSLRGLANGVSLGEDDTKHLDAVREASSLLRQARYSAILWDTKTTTSPQGMAIVSALTLLARDLNAITRSVARPLGAGGNVAGAVAALAAATGYPRAIGFAEGTPRHAPGEFDAARMLLPGRADYLLLVGARSAEAGNKKDDAARPPAGPRRRKRDLGGRVVVIGPRLPRGVDRPDVWIPTSMPGLSAAGTVTRADGVTVVLKALVPSRLPTEDEVLDRLLERCAARSRSRKI